MTYTVPARFNVHPESQTNYTAGEVTLFCIAGGLPLPSIIWLKDGEELEESETVFIENEETSTNISGEATSTLTIIDLVLSDAAVYQCVANNTGAPDISFTAFSHEVNLTVLCKYCIIL